MINSEGWVPHSMDLRSKETEVHEGVLTVFTAFSRYRKEPIFKALMQVWRVCKKRMQCNFQWLQKKQIISNPRPQWTWSTSWRSSLSTSPSCSRASRTLRSSARLARSSGSSRWQLKAKSRIDVDYLWVKKCIFLPRRWCGFWGFIALFVTLQACSLYSSPSNRHSAYI